MRLVHEWLEAAASRLPDKTALVCGDRRLTYADLDSGADRVANGLIEAGIHPGDRVAVFLENSPEAVIALFGILKAGAAFTMVSPSMKADKLGVVIGDERASALITANDGPRGRAVAGLLPAVRPPMVVWVGGSPDSSPSHDTGSHDTGWDELLGRAGSDRPSVEIDDGYIGTIIYTSGTTGDPKGVVSLHRDMAFATTSIISSLDQTDQDVILSTLSLAFTYGLYQLITSVAVGGTLVLEKGFAFPHRTLTLMDKERVTGFPGVPTIFRILTRLDGIGRYDLSSLRYLTNAAAPLPSSLLQDVRRTFPQARFYSMYGQTECKRTLCLPPEELDRRPESVGVAIPGTEVDVVDEQGNPVPPRHVGELVVRGGHIMAGYWEKPDETAQRLRTDPDGRTVMYSGDLFYRDDEGFLYFVSRADDIIKTRGEKVSPKEIEETLRKLPGIVDVAAIGVPDEVLGEAIKVFVVAESDSHLSDQDICGFCLQNLEDFMVPKVVEFCAQLPTNENGKILKKELRSCVA